MIRYITGRTLSGIMLVAVVAFGTFAMLYGSSGDIARRLLGESATPETVARKSEELGLNRPLWEQFWEWVSSAVTGDLGRSWVNGQRVSDAIESRLPVTLSLVVLTVALTAIIAIFLGMLAAYRGGWVDSLIQILSVVALAIPGFLIALWLVLIFAVGLGWFHATGYTPMTQSFSGWLASVILPVIALAIGAIAGVAQQIRGSILDTIDRDYVRTLRSRGLPMNHVLYRHVLRNASGPALTILGLQFIGLIAGAVFVEQIFALPGIGQLAINATLSTDVPVVMGVVVVIAVVVVVGNLLIDLAQGALNPRARR
ncbi:ABC transporter permease [Frankia sp. R43]|uniref:ABC transporter permease n=2 Tax=unclassified Frankia TaxID=2632575 RepID=UPI0006C9E7DC|nr:ABC transporter permease [Frankia sp. R43]KPM50651.1 ABC transporter permease [Frankia sp. R43]